MAGGDITHTQNVLLSPTTGTVSKTKVRSCGWGRQRGWERRGWKEMKFVVKLCTRGWGKRSETQREVCKKGKFLLNFSPSFRLVFFCCLIFFSLSNWHCRRHRISVYYKSVHQTHNHLMMRIISASNQISFFFFYCQRWCSRSAKRSERTHKM